MKWLIALINTVLCISPTASQYFLDFHPAFIEVPQDVFEGLFTTPPPENFETPMVETNVAATSAASTPKSIATLPAAATNNNDGMPIYTDPETLPIYTDSETVITTPSGAETTISETGTKTPQNATTTTTATTKPKTTPTNATTTQIKKKDITHPPTPRKKTSKNPPKPANIVSNSRLMSIPTEYVAGYSLSLPDYGDTFSVIYPTPAPFPDQSYAAQYRDIRSECSYLSRCTGADPQLNTEQLIYNIRPTVDPTKIKRIGMEYNGMGYTNKIPDSNSFEVNDLIYNFKLERKHNGPGTRMPFGFRPTIKGQNALTPAKRRPAKSHSHKFESIYRTARPFENHQNIFRPVNYWDNTPNPQYDRNILRHTLNIRQTVADDNRNNFPKIMEMERKILRSIGLRKTIDKGDDIKRNFEQVTFWPKPEFRHQKSI